MEAQSAKTSASISRSRRIRRILIVLPVVLIILLALFHLVENWRGKRAWEEYRQEVKKTGGRLDMADFESPPVQEDQNFAMTPLLQPLFSVPLDEDASEYQRVMSIRHIGPPWQGEARPGNWRKGAKTDLVSWQTYYRTDTNMVWDSQNPDRAAKDVIAALDRFDDELDELREAVKRPHSQFLVVFEEKGDPTTWRVKHLEALRNIVVLLKIRALAALELGHPDQALADVELMMGLAGKLGSNRFILDHLVRINLWDHSLQPVWEGLVAHRWSDTQLERLRKLLRGHDLIADLGRVMETERGYTIDVISFLRRNPRQLSKISGVTGDSPVSSLTALIPSTNSIAGGLLLTFGLPEGWFYFEQVNYARSLDQFYLQGLPDSLGSLRIGIEKDRNQRLQQWLAEGTGFKALQQHDVFARLFLPHVLSLMPTTLAGQTRYFLAETALALEQHRRKEGKYPERLAELVPDFLEQMPLDLIDRQPLRYRTNPDGSYDLWSVGWDELDDQGAIGVGDINGVESMQLEIGDWVWSGGLPVKTIRK